MLPISIVQVVGLGLQGLPANPIVIPVGEPETVALKLTGTAVPEMRVTVTLLIAVEPWVTD